MADKKETNPNVYEKKTVFEAAGDKVVTDAYEYAKGYMKFLDGAKTEREAVAIGVRMAEDAGYRAWHFGDSLTAGGKYYYNNRGKNLFVFRIGSEPINEGVRITCAHIEAV